MTEEKIENLQLEILKLLGYDIADPSIKETGKRVAKFLHQYKKKDLETEEKMINKLTMFEEKGYDQIVIKKGIKFNSLCEHHVLPFVGEVTIAYLPVKNGDDSFKIVGTSKLARIVKYFAIQLTIQERLTSDIAYFIEKHLNAKGVWVIIKSNHYCEKIRGIRNSSEMITSKVLGEFRENHQLKREAEFLLKM